MRLQCGRARARASRDYLWDAGRRRRSVSQSRREQQRVAIRAQTRSAPPSNALHAKVPAANALCQCDDAANDRILRVNNAARVLFQARAVTRPMSEYALAAVCDSRSLDELIRW